MLRFHSQRYNANIDTNTQRSDGRKPVETMHENDILAETENMIVWRSEEEQVGYMFHVELGGVSLHLLPEEWDEIVLLIKSAIS